MSEITKGGFVGYEYKLVTVDSARASICLDGYESFGWISDERPAPLKIGAPLTMRLKRDRKIANKAELTRLQRNFEACLAEIELLEKSKSQRAALFSVLTGLIGTAFMALATFAATGEPPRIVLCILFAVPGFAGWGLPYFIYKRLAERRSRTLAPLLENKFDEIYELCKKGSRLL